MKKFIITLTAIFICTNVHAEILNINYMNEDNTVYENGTCIIGGDLILPTPPTKRGYTFNGWMPANVQQIEYLESTGTQWIDTGLKTNGYDKFVSYWYSIKDTGNYALYGGSNGSITSGERGIFWNGHTIDYVTPYSPTTSNFTSIQGLWYSNRDYVIDDDLYYIKINDAVAKRNVSASFQSKYNFQIFDFTRNGYSRLVPSTVRLKQFKWYRNDILVRDFIPVLDPNGVPCMYDKVEHKFYYNAGTGQFVAGPVIGE